jgi:hypothetical protein
LNGTVDPRFRVGIDIAESMSATSASRVDGSGWTGTFMELMLGLVRTAPPRAKSTGWISGSGKIRAMVG